MSQQDQFTLNLLAACMLQQQQTLKKMEESAHSITKRLASIEEMLEWIEHRQRIAAQPANQLRSPNEKQIKRAPNRRKSSARKRRPANA